MTFSKSKVVYQYDLEVKNLFTGLATHGASNYQMYLGDKIIRTKMRSYKNKEYPDFDVDKKEVTSNYSRTVEWLNSIYKSPNSVKREEPILTSNEVCKITISL
uniref:Uncharacterized protein n=1 Tax=Cliftonaea pectinata TaxID=2007206 RepID=A0A1Z1MQA5_9FLOR|nr:hypothetical protein [Cliftonaea pectinata]ARW68126.1 hypothetical protein [Cliftonaea pectinata]